MELNYIYNFFLKVLKNNPLIKYLCVVGLFFLCANGNAQGSVFFNISEHDLIASETPTNEGNFTVFLNPPNSTTRDILVTAAISGSASLTTDYLFENISASGVIRFAPGEFRKNINIVSIVDDNLIEGDETITLTLRSVNNTNYSITSTPTIATATVTIEDNDTCPSVNVRPVLDTTIPTRFCDVINQDLNDYIISGPPPNTVLTWSPSSNLLDTDAHIIDTEVSAAGTYNAFFYNATDNCAGPPVSVELQRFITPTVERTNSPLPSCGDASFVLEAEASAGGTLRWYDSDVAGTLLVEGRKYETPVINVTTTYYVEATANGCPSPRTAVIATVNRQPSAGTTTDTVACSFAGGGSITTLDLETTIVDYDAGEWSITTDPSGSLVIGTGNLVDFDGVISGNYIFTYTTNLAEAPCSNESTTLNVTVETCTVDTDNDGINDEDEDIIGTDPNNPDTDNDGINDGVEVGGDFANPLDTDIGEDGTIFGDGIIDALDSNTLDSDGDLVVDQLDPENTNPCIPSNTATTCDTDGDGITDGQEIGGGTDHLDSCDPYLTPACMPDDIDLMVEKTADKPVLNIGEDLVFTITLTNVTGDRRIINIEVDDLLPSLFIYVSHETSKGDYNEATGIWSINEISPNEEPNTLNITVKIADVASGNYENTASIVTSFPNDSDITNNESSVFIEVNSRSNNDCGFLFNQFSPNADGTNDLLRINCIENYPNNTLEIYDRYGNIVFEAKGYNNTWDGSRKDENLPKGTYFYILNLGDGSEVKKGWIQIIR